MKEIKRYEPRLSFERYGDMEPYDDMAEYSKGPYVRYEDLIYIIEEAAKIAEDEDGAITVWGEDRNTAVSQQTGLDIAKAILKLKEKL